MCFKDELLECFWLVIMNRRIDKSFNSSKIEIKMDIDFALAELGMLSAVTDARREFLMEKFARRLHRNDENRRFTHSSAGPSDYKAWETDRSVPLLSLRRPWLQRSSSTSRNRHIFHPYDHLKSSHHQRLTALCVQSPNTLSIPTVSVTPQNKSNPGSPVKSSAVTESNYLLGVGAPLVRSKSLDNIAICVEVEGTELSRKILPDMGVDTVSHKISNLQLAN